MSALSLLDWSTVSGDLSLDWLTSSADSLRDWFSFLVVLFVDWLRSLMWHPRARYIAMVVESGDQSVASFTATRSDSN